MNLGKLNALIYIDTSRYFAFDISILKIDINDSSTPAIIRFGDLKYAHKLLENLLLLGNRCIPLVGVHGPDT